MVAIIAILFSILPACGNNTTSDQRSQQSDQRSRQTVADRENFEAPALALDAAAYQRSFYDDFETTAFSTLGPKWSPDSPISVVERNGPEGPYLVASTANPTEDIQGMQVAVIDGGRSFSRPNISAQVTGFGSKACLVIGYLASPSDDSESYYLGCIEADRHLVIYQKQSISASLTPMAVSSAKALLSSWWGTLQIRISNDNRLVLSFKTGSGSQVISISTEPVAEASGAPGIAGVPLVTKDEKRTRVAQAEFNQVVIEDDDARID